MFAKRIVLFVATNLAVVLLLSLVLRVLGVDQALDQRGLFSYEGLLTFAAVLGFGGSFVSLALSKWIAKASTGARVIEVPRSQTEAWLLETVHRQAARAGIDTPEVAVYPSPDPNAFATGMRRNHALVAVSTGLLEGMSRREVEAVLAHEVSHVANGDMITMALLQGVVNTFVVFLARVVGFFVDRVLLRGDDEEHSGLGIGYWITVMACELLFGVLASVIVMWFSRRREFSADRGAADLEGPQAMIAALRRLQAAHEPSALPKALAAFGIREGGGGLGRLFLSHPPLEERI
ncbi:MAG TPA: protease HtpX, partial [Planctomycetes bacterium]|nr:protease HtpX [Planctomycetota bacterium]